MSQQLSIFENKIIHDMSQYLAEIGDMSKKITDEEWHSAITDFEKLKDNFDISVEKMYYELIRIANILCSDKINFENVMSRTFNDGINIYKKRIQSHIADMKKYYHTLLENNIDEDFASDEMLPLAMRLKINKTDSVSTLQNILCDIAKVSPEDAPKIHYEGKDIWQESAISTYLKLKVNLQSGLNYNIVQGQKINMVSENNASIDWQMPPELYGYIKLTSEKILEVPYSRDIFEKYQESKIRNIEFDYAPTISRLKIPATQFTTPNELREYMEAAHKDITNMLREYINLFIEKLATKNKLLPAANRELRITMNIEVKKYFQGLQKFFSDHITVRMTDKKYIYSLPEKDKFEKISKMYNEVYAESISEIPLVFAVTPKLYTLLFAH